MTISNSYIVFFVLLLSLHECFAQELGKAFIKNYSPKEYNGHTQNWCVTEDKRGFIYVGNGDGVMIHDGSRWSVVTIKNAQTPRSMGTDEKGTIFIGSVGLFGYLESTPNGKYQYVELSHLLAEEHQKFKGVWATIPHQDKVYFQTPQKLFEYHKKSKKVKAYPSKNIRYSFCFQNRFYAVDVEKGILQIDGDSLVNAPLGAGFKFHVVGSSSTFQKDKILLITAQSGLFLYSPQTGVEKFSSEIDNSLQESTFSLYCATGLKDGSVALGTTGKGILILNKHGKILRTISPETGLQDHSPYGLFQDSQGQLWAALSKGVSHIDITNPISFWDEKSGLIGVVEDVIRFKGMVYVATHRGIFYIENQEVKQIEGSTGQAWAFEEVLIGKDTFLLASDGTIRVGEIRGKTITPIPNAKEFVGFEFYIPKNRKNTIFIGDKDGFFSLKRENGTWINEGKVSSDISDDIRGIAQEEDGTIWLGSFRNGAYRIKNAFSSEKPIIKKYGKEEGFSLLRNVLPFHYQNRIIFGSEGGLFSYNPKIDRMEADTTFGKHFADGSRDVFWFYEDRLRNEIWISGLFNNKSPMGKLTLRKDGKSGFDWDESIFKKMPQMMLLALYVEKDGKVWVGGSEGLFLYDRSQVMKESNQPKTYIREVVVGVDSVLFYGNFVDNKTNRLEILKEQPSSFYPEIEYDYNSLIIRFSSPDFNDENGNEYSYKLEGFDDDWSSWSTKTEKEYTNLYEKSYIFRVKSRNIYGVESKETSFSFHIKPPWFRALWAYIGYFVGAIAFVYLLIRYYVHRLEKDKERLERIVAERTAEISYKNLELEQQKEEINMQAENLKIANQSITEQKEQVEKSYQNISILSHIGKEITATLDVKQMIGLLYGHVNALMPAECFGVGVLNLKQDRLDYYGFIEKGVELPFHHEKLSQTDRLSIKCLLDQREIVSNNLFNDHETLTGVPLFPSDYGEVPASLIFIPLLLEKYPIGVITVQSFIPNAYDEQSVNMLRSLASYAAVAIDNGNAYRLIEQKNHHITDSIRYAQTIQNAILPQNDEFRDGFQDYFIFYRPKDIVSGDFYWFLRTVNKRFIAVADCTGHGVPGAFMSMIGASLLNEAVSEKRYYTPSKILSWVNNEIIYSLRQEEKANSDGMDMALCCVEYQEGEKVKVTFAGGKRGIYYVDSAFEIQEVKGDLKSIGGLRNKNAVFADVDLYFERGTVLYLLTDGFADQNNNENKKIGSTQLKELLSLHASQDLKVQKEILENYFDTHRGYIDQRDDVTIIAVKL